MTSIAEQPVAPQGPLFAMSGRRVHLALEAEIFQDLDDGTDSLIVTTDALACEPVSPARLRSMVADARAQLDAIEQLADTYEAEDTIRAILAEHNATLHEWDVATAPPELRKHFFAFAVLNADNTKDFIVAAGLSPIERAEHLAELANRLDEKAGEA